MYYVYIIDLKACNSGLNRILNFKYGCGHLSFNYQYIYFYAIQRAN